MKPYDKKIILENGMEFYGYGFGSNKQAINEIVFNTSMVGYQEIISDPSYTDQMVCMTYPLIGNYGMTDDEEETLYGYIDRKGKPLGKFRRIMEFSELETMKQEAYAKLDERP